MFGRIVSYNFIFFRNPDNDGGFDSQNSSTFLNYASLPRSIYIVISCVGACADRVCHNKLYYRFVRFAAADRVLESRATIIEQELSIFILD